MSFKYLIGWGKSQKLFTQDDQTVIFLNQVLLTYLLQREKSDTRLDVQIKEIKQHPGKDQWKYLPQLTLHHVHIIGNIY